MHPLIESKELGPLEFIDLYLDYDGPRLFSCKDGRGHLYVAVWVHESETSDVWLYAPVSRKRLLDIEADNVDLRSAFAATESGKVLKLSNSHESAPPLIETIDCSDIPEEWLPLAGSSLTELRNL
jgi:Family of unknown function (DUF6575)